MADESGSNPTGTAPHSASHSRPQSESRDTQPLVLVVEDNRADVLLVKRAIEYYDVQVRLVVVEDGEAALDYFAAAETDPSIQCPDILLLDLNLPKRTGIEVLEKVRAGLPCHDVRTVILSSSDSAEDRRRTAQLGAIRYFRKPTSYLEFLKLGEVLREVLPQG